MCEECVCVRVCVPELLRCGEEDGGEPGVAHLMEVLGLNLSTRDN